MAGEETVESGATGGGEGEGGGEGDTDTDTGTDTDGDITAPEGTTTTRYRWKGLSTLVTIYLVLLYPSLLVLILSGEISNPGGMVLSVLTLGWLSGIGYAIGTDILRDVQQLRGGSGGGG